MKRIYLIILALAVITGLGFGQGKVTRQKKVKTEQSHTSNNKRNQETRKKPTQASPKPTPKVAVSQPDGEINGHGYVDLGLPSGIKWATCNIGATSPEEYGDYFALGDTKPKSEYNIDNCITWEKTGNELKSMGIINSSGNLTSNYDAAYVNWGRSWRTPTKDEYQELKDNCKWEWITLNGKNGYRITGPNKNSIFLSAADCRSGSSIYHAGSYGYYWSSTPNGSGGAYVLYFGSSVREVYNGSRRYGQPVRAVTE